MLIVRGSGRYVYEGSAYEIGPNDLLFIRPFERHRLELFSSSEHLAVHFDLSPDVQPRGAGLDRQAYAVTIAEGQTLRPWTRLDADDVAATLLEGVVDAFATGDPLDEATAGSRLLRVLLSLLRRHERPRDARFEAAAELINHELDGVWTADRLAGAVGLSSSQCRRLFVQWTGLTPMAYIRQKRVNRARRLLAEGELSIKEIAFRCGFADPLHFSRLFRKIDGLSPSQYRQEAQAGR